MNVDSACLQMQQSLSVYPNEISIPVKLKVRIVGQSDVLCCIGYFPAPNEFTAVIGSHVIKYKLRNYRIGNSFNALYFLYASLAVEIDLGTIVKINVIIGFQVIQFFNHV